MLDIITLPQQTSGFMIQVESVYSDESSLPAIETVVAHQPEDDDSVSERNFFLALEQVLNTLNQVEKGDLPEYREIAQLLSSTAIPICSVESIALLLGHIYQEVVMNEVASQESQFLRAFEDVLEGFAQMNKDDSLVPQELESLFDRDPSPSLLEAMTTLLDPSMSEKDDDSISVHHLELSNVQKDCAFSDCATTVATTDVGSGVTDLDWPSPQSSETTNRRVQDHRTPLKFNLRELIARGGAADINTDSNIQVADELYETTSADSLMMRPATSSVKRQPMSRKLDPLAFRYLAEREDLLIPQLSNRTMESLSGVEMEHTESKTQLSHNNDTLLLKKTSDTLPASGDMYITDILPKEEPIKTNAHYDEALHNIQTIRTILRLQEHNEEEKADANSATSVLVEATSSDVAINKSEPKAELEVIELPTTPCTYKQPIQKPVREDSGVVATDDCDSTVECSLDSINITDDEASLKSETTEGSGFFNCAMDTVLDALLGTCWDDDVLGSAGSCCGPCDGSCYSEDYFSSSISVAESVNDSPVTDDRIKERAPLKMVLIDIDHELKTERAKSPLMKSDSECHEGSTGSGEWWIRDVKGEVETESLTSF